MSRKKSKQDPDKVELFKALDEIEAVRPDDEGVRTIPPGFLDRARKILNKVRKEMP